MSSLSIRNARIVTATEILTGSLHTERENIAQIAPSTSGLAGEDWHGDYLLPGLVELHTDNLEKHLCPRPKVTWPLMSAILMHDAEVAAAGITTVLDALAVGDIDHDSVRMRSLPGCIEGLQRAQDQGLLRSEHLLHLRLELAEPRLIELFSAYVHDPRLKLVSLMDHTPGQRQWADLQHYRTYVSGKRGWSTSKIDGMLDDLLQRQQLYADVNRCAAVSLCRTHGQAIPLATHDDTDVAHVQEGVAEGVVISEFPTTLAAAQAAREHGLGIVMGAPNLVRGGSHSGNVSAAELAAADLLDVFSSDYVPASLLYAAFLLQQHDWSLPRAVATVSRNPARYLGLHDRGEIACGLRADFIRVRLLDGVPVVLGVWRSGRRIV